MMDAFSAIRESDPSAARVAMAAVFTFAAVFLLVIGVSTYLRAKVAVRRRAAASFEGNAADEPFGASHFEDTRSLHNRNLSATSALLSDIERGVARDRGETSKIRRELLRAGFFSPRAIYLYQALRAFLFPAGGLLGYFAYSYFFPGAAPNSPIIAGAALAGAAFLAPSRFVTLRKKRLIRDCQEGFPDFIDLMIVCAEAGLGPRSAIDRLSREIAKTNRLLGAHLYLANVEIRAGSSLHQALLSLSRRTQVEEAATLAALLEQTEQLGTSITDALRVYRDEMRERRLVRAEEKAHSLAARLVLPLGIFVFPVLLIVILLPAVIRMQHALN